MFTASVNSVPQFVVTILELAHKWYPKEPCSEVWYRGCCDRHPLLPGAYWRKSCDEQSLALTFRSLVPSYLPREPQDDFEWYYLMQHYGLPTRLLDWTENPLVALFFALWQPEKRRRPCVWVMDPVKLNEAVHGPDQQVIIVPLGGDSADTRYWLPDHCGRESEIHVFDTTDRFRDNRKPLAVFPKRYNPRIVAQRGVFTIHGMDEIAIDDLLCSDPPDSNNSLARIDIDLARGESLLDDLWTLGLNRSALFPEPQSVADDLKRSYRVDGAC